MSYEEIKIGDGEDFINDDKEPMSANLSKHKPNMTRIYFGYQIIICTNPDFSQIYDHFFGLINWFILTVSVCEWETQFMSEGMKSAGA